MTKTYYANLIRKILASNGIIPPIEVLENLLRWYIANAEKWYTKRNHTMLATLMVFWIEDYRKTLTENNTSKLSRPDALLRKLSVKLNTLELMDANPDGEFVALMNSFFACYPDYAAFLQPSVMTLLAASPDFFDPRQPVNYQLKLLSGNGRDQSIALRIISTFNYAYISPEQRQLVMQKLFSLLLSGSLHSFQPNDLNHLIKGIHRLHKDFAVEMAADGLGKLLNISKNFETLSNIDDCYQLYYLEVCSALLDIASEQQKTHFTSFVLVLYCEIKPHTPAKEKIKIAIQKIQNHLAQEFQIAATALHAGSQSFVNQADASKLLFYFAPSTPAALIKPILEVTFVSNEKESCLLYQRFLAEADVSRIFDKILAGVSSYCKDHQQAACDLLQALTHPRSPHAEADIRRGLTAYAFLRLIFNSKISSSILVAIHKKYYPEILLFLSNYVQNGTSLLIANEEKMDFSNPIVRGLPLDATDEIQSLSRLIRELIQQQAFSDELTIAVLPMLFAKTVPATTIIQSLKPLTPAMILVLQKHAHQNVKFLMDFSNFFINKKLYGSHLQDFKLLQVLLTGFVSEEQLILGDLLLQEINVRNYPESSHYGTLYETLSKTFIPARVNLSKDVLEKRLSRVRSEYQLVVIDLIWFKALIPFASPEQRKKILNKTIISYNAMSEEDFKKYEKVQPHALAAKIIISLFDWLPTTSYPSAHVIFRAHLLSTLTSAEDCLKTYAALRSLNTASKLQIDDDFNVRIAMKNLLFVAKSYPQILRRQIDKISLEVITDPANESLCVSFAQELFSYQQDNNFRLLNLVIDFYIRCLGSSLDLTSVVTSYLHQLWDAISHDRKLYLYERYALLLDGLTRFLRDARLKENSEDLSEHKIAISVLNRFDSADIKYKKFINVFVNSRLFYQIFSLQEVSSLFGLMSDSMKQHIVNVHLNKLYADSKNFEASYTRAPAREWYSRTEATINYFAKNISVFDNASRMLLINAYLNLLAETKMQNLANFMLNVLHDLQPYIPIELRDKITVLLLKRLDSNFDSAFNVLLLREQQYSPLERKIYFYPLMLCEYAARLNSNGSIPQQYYPLQTFASLRYNDKQYARQIIENTKLNADVIDLITGYFPPFSL
jgi:hypothetical protein